MNKEVCSFCNDNKFVWNSLCANEGCAEEDAIPKNCESCDWGKDNKCDCSNFRHKIIDIISNGYKNLIKCVIKNRLS